MRKIMLYILIVLQFGVPLGILGVDSWREAQVLEKGSVYIFELEWFEYGVGGIWNDGHPEDSLTFGLKSDKVFAPGSNYYRVAADENGIAHFEPANRNSKNEKDVVDRTTLERFVAVDPGAAVFFRNTDDPEALDYYGEAENGVFDFGGEQRTLLAEYLVYKGRAVLKDITVNGVSIAEYFVEG